MSYIHSHNHGWDECNIKYSHTSLYICLGRICFKYKTTDKRQTLMELKYIQIIPSKYLVAIKTYDKQKTTIIYGNEK